MIVLQVLSIVGGIANGTLADTLSISSSYDIGRLIGFFFFGVLGVILLCTANRKKKTEENSAQA